MIPDNLNKSINNLDINMAKSIVINQIENDRDAMTFQVLDWAAYAERKFRDKEMFFFQEDDGFSSYVEEKSEWTKELWNTMRSEFTFNYSKVKLERIVSIMLYLREQGHPYFQAVTEVEENSLYKQKVPNNSQDNQPDFSDKKEKSNRDYYISCGVGAVLGSVGGKLLGFGIAGLVVGAAVGLAVVYSKKNRG